MCVIKSTSHLCQHVLSDYCCTSSASTQTASGLVQTHLGLQHHPPTPTQQHPGDGLARSTACTITPNDRSSMHQNSVSATTSQPITTLLLLRGISASLVDTQLLETQACYTGVSSFSRSCRSWHDTRTPCSAQVHMWCHHIPCKHQSTLLHRVSSVKAAFYANKRGTAGELRSRRTSRTSIWQQCCSFVQIVTHNTKPCQPQSPILCESYTQSHQCSHGQTKG